MRKKIFGLTLSAMLFAHSFLAQAQQSAKIPRIGYLAGFGNTNNPGPQVEAFRKGCASSVTSRGRIFWLSTVTLKEAGSCPKSGRGASATQSRYTGHSTYRSDLRSQAGDQGDPHRNGD